MRCHAFLTATDEVDQGEGEQRSEKNRGGTFFARISFSDENFQGLDLEFKLKNEAEAESKLILV